MELHPGISMHRIPVRGVGGFLFAAGIVLIFLLNAPSLRPLAAACAVGGVLLAPVLHRRGARSATSVAAAVPLFALGMSFFLLTGNGLFRELVLLSLAGGLLSAVALAMRGNPASLSIREHTVR